MGSEFLSRTKTAITKHIDKKRVALGTPDLFTVTPTERPRRSIASIQSGAEFTSGEKLIVELMNGNLKLRRGNSVVGSLDNPSKDEVAAIAKSGGAANGIVQRIHKLSKKVEVSLC